MATAFTDPFMSDPEDEEKQRGAIEALAAASRGETPTPMPDMRSFAMGSPDVRETDSRMPDVPQLAAQAMPSKRELPSAVASPAAADDDDSGDEPGVSPWAIVADLLLNRGRGVGGIVGQAQGQKQSWRNMRRQGKRDQMENAARQQQVQLGNRNADLRGKEIGLEEAAAQRRYDMMMHPESIPENAQQKMERQQFEYRQKHDSDMMGQSRTLAEADDKRMQMQMEGMAADRAAQRGLQGAQIAESRRGHDLANQTRIDGLAAREAEKVAEAEAKQGIADERFMTGYAKNTEGSRKTLKNLQAIDAITSRYEKDPDGVPGLDASLALPEMANDAVGALSKGWKKATGKWDARQEGRATDGDTLRKLAVEVGQATLRDETGAAAALTEQQRQNIRIGMGPSATQAQRLESLRIARSAQEGAIQGFSAANPKAARRVLEAEGLKADFIRDASAPPAAAAAEPATQGKVKVTSPSGKVGYMDPSDPRFAKAQAAGWKVEQ